MRLSTASLSLLLLSSVLPPALFAALTDTGMDRCDDGAGALVPCSEVNTGDFASRPRQDGRFGRDAAAIAGTLVKVGAGVAGFDYSKIANDGSLLPADAPLGAGGGEWACTRDNVTGLLWEVKTATHSDLRSYQHGYTWHSTDALTNGGDSGVTGSNTCFGTLPGNLCNTAAFLEAVNSLTLCGFSDWRLPSLAELHSVLYFGAVDPGIDSTFFPNTASTTHWTSSTDSSTPANAWVVDFSNSIVDVSPKTSNPFVRLVRGGVVPDPGAALCAAGNPNPDVLPATPDSDFTPHGDGTVTHLATGLMWKECVEGKSGVDCATGTASFLDWAEALQSAVAANAAAFGGHDDWRLPNQQELLSIVETCGRFPTINQNAFPGTPSVALWSSTTYARTPVAAHEIEFNDGSTNTTHKDGNLHARLVRDAGGAGPTPTDVPTLGEWGFGLFVLLLSVCGVLRLKVSSTF